jgi:outer membrane receptor for ferrienterochelin and colicin
VSPWGQTGDFGRHDYGLDAGIVWNNFSLGLFFDHKSVDNYYLYDDMGMDDTNRDHEHNRFHGKLTGTLGESTHISLSGGVVDGKTGFGLSDNFGLENEQNFEHTYLNFQITSQITEKLDITAQLDWLRTEHKYHGETLESITYPPFPPPIPTFNYTASVNNTESNRYRGDISMNYFFNDNNILTLGSEIVYTKAEKAIRGANTGDLIDVQGRPGEKIDKNDTLYSFYAQYDWIFLKNFELVLGARFDDYDSYGSEFSPKGTLCWHYADGGHIKLSAGKGFKAPNLNQLYSPPWSIAPFTVYDGNPDLKAETLWSYQLSLEQRAFNKKLFFRVSPYYTEAENFITSVRNPDPYNANGQIMRPENVDEVEIRGVDVELAYDLLKSITLFANYNYNETRDGKTEEILEGYPRNSASLGFRFRHRFAEDWRLVGSYAARYRGDYTTSSWGSPPVTETVGDYWYHTAKVGLDWNDMIFLNVSLFNIFNDRTKTDIDNYLPQFNYMAGLTFKYSF